LQRLQIRVAVESVVAALAADAGDADAAERRDEIPHEKRGVDQIDRTGLAAAGDWATAAL